MTHTSVRRFGSIRGGMTNPPEPIFAGDLASETPYTAPDAIRGWWFARRFALDRNLGSFEPLGLATRDAAELDLCTIGLAGHYGDLEFKWKTRLPADMLSAVAFARNVSEDGSARSFGVYFSGDARIASPTRAPRRMSTAWAEILSLLGRDDVTAAQASLENWARAWLATWEGVPDLVFDAAGSSVAARAAFAVRAGLSSFEAQRYAAGPLPQLRPVRYGLLLPAMRW